MGLEMIEKDRQGMVLRIERSSIHDGDGFRTVVFFKGCPLRCQWCSTPESQSFGVEHTADNAYGSLMTVEEVMKEIRKDSLFFFLSTGGVTLSGGEVLSQPEFALALLRNCKKECFNTAVETCFFGPWEHIETMLPYINTIYADMKLIDSDLHKKYCGVDNSLILDNMLRTNEVESKLRLVIRTPIIPGINDSDEELNRIGEFCAKLRHLDYVQLLPYHRLGTETYKKLGRPYLLEHVKSPSFEEMERCRNVIRQYVGKTI
ncbi:glycyl-radical enzyme activating protein [Butyricicoccus faecihominis]|uniref:glycyl-radical enzyme activating protein n=1 Tax=Butyricicoccaceae TaxID=3085642 RepID=UPI0024794BF2|nr:MULTISPECIES: glycyl-radical enzyme activating protein [Butyricicoccaceae]MCQ5131161.1 glycyl-radical enzyme activating protein [Butyricicoccus faecihominis]WNX84337.1 glycyl-radical enzyme activating protein [Agathobaculum sp. NTUH-O15-33]